MAPRGSNRGRIVEAAERLVSEEGAAHLTLDAVAGDAGVSKGGLLYHFPSKEALLEGMLERLLEHFDELHRRLEAGLPESPVRGLVAYVRACLADGQQSASGLLAALAHNPRLLEPARQYYRRKHRELTPPGGDAGMVATIMLAADGLWLQEHMGLSPLDAEEREAVRERLESMCERVL